MNFVILTYLKIEYILIHIFCYNYKETKHHEQNILNSLPSSQTERTLTVSTPQDNIPDGKQDSSTIEQCTCNAREKLACNTCMSISNMGVECTQIIIKPGDVVTYTGFDNIYKYHYGTIASLRRI